MSLKRLIARLVSREPKPLVFTIDEAAGLLKVCPRTVKQMIYAGELESRKLRRRTVIPVAAIDKLVR